jgi:hypothetical protein
MSSTFDPVRIAAIREQLKQSVALAERTEWLLQGSSERLEITQQPTLLLPITLLPPPRPGTETIERRQISYETIALPAVERYDIRIHPTEWLVAEAVRRFLKANGGCWLPDVVYVHLLRLLTVPAKRWNFYPVELGEGEIGLSVITVELRSSLVVPMDEAWPRCEWLLAICDSHRK